ncbi:hypothetical protein, partial [Pseudomonas sp. FSL R10-2172]|uniref:hypothetical protein n=1 Tax=Pseudomonas sp. FSL R10-2172 TaxID=2662198 RepID=UPI001C499D6E
SMSSPDLNTSNGMDVAALRYLYEKLQYGFPLATSRILTNLDIKEGKRPMLLKVLHHLKHIGILSSNGSGNIRWSISDGFKEKGLTNALAHFGE